MKICNESSWDTVEKSRHSHGELAMIDALQSSADLLDEWGFSRLQMAWNEAIRSFRDDTNQMDTTVAS